MAKSKAATGGAWPAAFTAVSAIWFQSAIGSAALAFATKVLAIASTASPYSRIFMSAPPFHGDAAGKRSLALGSENSKYSDRKLLIIGQVTQLKRHRAAR